MSINISTINYIKNIINEPHYQYYFHKGYKTNNMIDPISKSLIQYNYITLKTNSIRLYNLIYVCVKQEKYDRKGDFSYIS